MAQVITSRYGHDIAFSTANRPTNAEVGFTGYDTTIGALMVVDANGNWQLAGGKGQSTVAALGTNQATAAPLALGFNVVTGADGTKGVVLPAGTAGQSVEGYNGSASNLLVYPPSTGTINDGSANASVTVAAHTAFSFHCDAATAWVGTYAAGGTYATLTGSETLTNKTITTPTISLNVASPAAAGTNQGTATAITTASPGLLHATGADGTKGVALPAAVAGSLFFMKNDDAANAVLKVYPNGTDTINALSASAAISMAAKTAATFFCVTTGAWYTSPLLPS